MDITAMISERHFATAYTSFWRQLLPDAEDEVRRLNLAAERTDPLLPSTLPPARRAFVNEASFDVFAEFGERRGYQAFAPLCAADAKVAAAATAAARRLAHALNVEPSHGALAAGELTEAVELAEGLRQCLQLPMFQAHLSCRHRLPGCGILASAVVDVCYDDCLVEVKAGERPVRGIDLRQILTYGALDYGRHNAPSFHRFEIVNPRLWLRYGTSFEGLCLRAAFRPPHQVFSDILAFVERSPVSI